MLYNMSVIRRHLAGVCSRIAFFDFADEARASGPWGLGLGRGPPCAPETRMTRRAVIDMLDEPGSTVRRAPEPHTRGR